MDVGERYVLGRLIGEGATACVYEAADSVLQREVAVKVFRDVEIDDSGSERIDEEARILASLAHPHLLPVFDSGRDADGHRFLVMPLVRGTTLARRLARGPVDPREVKRIAKALAEALSHIHARGVVHRDVKPSNVLLAEDGTPYLADFGFAHALDGPALTATGCVVGTAGYLAPEQAEGLSVTPAADVYALGLVVLEALTGDRAYHGTPLERATANALRPPCIPARLGPGWLQVLRTMTARNPSARPTVGDVGLLLALAEDEPPEVTAVDGTMELPSIGPWTGLLSDGVPESGSPAVSSRAAAVGAVGAGAGGGGRGPRTRRGPAALGAAAFAAFALAGLGVGWLTSGASAASHGPGLTTPGAGTPGTQRTQPPVPAPVTTVARPVPTSTVYVPAGLPVTPSAEKCHGKHKCQGGSGDGGGEDH